MALTDLPGRLQALLAKYRPGVAFVKAGNELDFAQVAEVIDVTKGAGWKRIGLMPAEPRQ